MEELKPMVTQYMQHQEKFKSKHVEGSNRKREHNKDPYYQREWRSCSNPCYSNFCPPSPKHYHRHRTLTYAHKPKVDLSPFYEKKNVKKYLEI